MVGKKDVVRGGKKPKRTTQKGWITVREWKKILRES